MADSPGALFESLLDIVERLRGPDGCPWDREQTPALLKPCLIEEAYEVIDAIDHGPIGALREELGDLLLQVVFQASLSAEARMFAIADVLRELADKLVRRHPHVFAGSHVGSAQEALVQWEQLKRAEDGRGAGASVLDGVPSSLPALMQAQKVQSRAARVGFDWPNAAASLDKVREEVGEVQDALAAADRGQIGEELGDLFFAVVNMARLAHIDAEDALRSATQKFSRRFRQLEADLAARHQDVASVTVDELNRRWDAVKARGQGETASPQS